MWSKAPAKKKQPAAQAPQKAAAPVGGDADAALRAAQQVASLRKSMSIAQSTFRGDPQADWKQVAGGALVFGAERPAPQVHCPVMNRS